MNDSYQDIMDQIDIEGKFELSNEDEIRLAMLKLYDLIKDCFVEEIQVIYNQTDIEKFKKLSSNEIEKFRVMLWETEKKIGQQREKPDGNENYNALRALICYFYRPLKDTNEDDTFNSFAWCLDFSLLTNKVSNDQVVKILTEIK